MNLAMVILFPRDGAIGSRYRIVYAEGMLD